MPGDLSNKTVIGIYILLNITLKLWINSQYIWRTPLREMWAWFWIVFSLQTSFEKWPCLSKAWGFLWVPQARVLARISKCLSKTAISKYLPVQIKLFIYFKSLIISATLDSLVCQKGQFTLQHCPRRRFVRKIFGYYTPKVKIEKSS